jgi:hypothetical protein
MTETNNQVGAKKQVRANDVPLAMNIGIPEYGHVIAVQDQVRPWV